MYLTEMKLGNLKPETKDKVLTGLVSPLPEHFNPSRVCEYHHTLRKVRKPLKTSGCFFKGAFFKIYGSKFRMDGKRVTIQTDDTLNMNNILSANVRHNLVLFWIISDNIIRAFATECVQDRQQLLKSAVLCKTKLVPVNQPHTCFMYKGYRYSSLGHPIPKDMGPLRDLSPFYNYVYISQRLILGAGIVNIMLTKPSLDQTVICALSNFVQGYQVFS